MEKYLLAFDMDGTLLNKNKKISFLTLNILRKLNKKGHKIVIASGRPPRSIDKYYRQLKLDTPIICYNGAYCYSPLDKGFPITEYKYSVTDVKNIYNELKPYINNIMCEDEHNIWVDKKDLFLNKFFWFENMNIHEGEFESILDKDTMTLIIHLPDNFDKRDYINETIKKYPGLGICYWTGSPYFELFHEGVSKGTSLNAIANYYNIKKENIIAFGDAENDVELFKYAGKSVAMINGKESLKRKADYVSPKDNNHNGIYHTLKKYFSNLF